ncbi:cytochrome P450 [Suillus americanus]|nr:cytochrome P450 [Suillus americanus]
MLILTNVTWLDILCISCAAVYLVMWVFNKKNPAPYPPGPPGWPLIGNILDMPHVKPWLTFAMWGKKYGNIAHIEVMGQHIMVVNSIKTAMDILDKKSTLYSDRPILPVGGELVGWKHSMTLLPDGDLFRRHRRNLHRVIGTRAAVGIYSQIEEVETRRFLKRVLTNPGQLRAHVRHTTGAIILRIAYGYEVAENGDPFVDLADRATDIFSLSTAPGAFVADFIPFLIKVPEWFPGAGFKRLARKWHETVEKMISEPYKFVEDQMAAGIAPESFTSNLLRDHTLSAEDDHVVKWSAGSLYAAGAGTTVSSVYSFFLAMTLFRDVQKKAQAEIDAVVGPDRLPSFADRDSLPYAEALVKEVLRWNAIAPTGFPHRVIQDDIHDGYFIPKGSLIMPILWSMLNDPQVYANPFQFNPERFLPNDGKKPETDPRTICFGFGKRICPGLHLAEASVWMSAVMSLAVFDISKVVENGIEITPEVDPLSGTISTGLDRHDSSYPKPFKCSVRPRSAKAVALIEQDANY